MSHDDNLDFRTTPAAGYALLLNADSVLTRRHVSSTQKPQNIHPHTCAVGKPKKLHISVDIQARIDQG